MKTNNATSETWEPARSTMRAAGFTRTVSTLTARVLAEAEAAGKRGHGFALIPAICDRLKEGHVRANLCLSLFPTGTSVSGFDANHSLGYAAAAIVCRILTQHATREGYAAGLIRNVDHIGAAGVYARRAASAGCLCVVTAAGRPRIAPWGGSRPAFGTTPVALGIPSIQGPLVIDVAMSQLNVGEVTSALREGTTLPLGTAQDSSGRPTVSPEAALAGSLVAIGGHKGASLAFGVHALTHSLAACPPDDHPVLMILLDCVRAPEFTSRVNAIVQEIRTWDFVKGSARVPGDSYNSPRSSN